MPSVIPESYSLTAIPLTHHPRYKKLELVFQRLDSGGNGAISFAEYLTLVETLEEEEIAAAREAFDALEPDINGDVKKAKFMEVQLRAFEFVSDREFEEWVHIMTQGMVIHPHTRKELEEAGVEIPDDFVDPVNHGIIMRGFLKIANLYKRLGRYMRAKRERELAAARELSLKTHRDHLVRVKKLKMQLAESTAGSMDENYAAAKSKLDNKYRGKAKERAMLMKQNEASQSLVAESSMSSPSSTTLTQSSTRMENKRFSGHRREEKCMDPVPVKGLKNGSAAPSLEYEDSSTRIQQAAFLRQQQTRQHGDSTNESLSQEALMETDEDMDGGSYFQTVYQG